MNPYTFRIDCLIDYIHFYPNMLTPQDIKSCLEIMGFKLIDQNDHIRISIDRQQDLFTYDSNSSSHIFSEKLVNTLVRQATDRGHYFHSHPQTLALFFNLIYKTRFCYPEDIMRPPWFDKVVYLHREIYNQPFSYLKSIFILSLYEKYASKIPNDINQNHLDSLTGQTVTYENFDKIIPIPKPVDKDSRILEYHRNAFWLTPVTSSVRFVPLDT